MPCRLPARALPYDWGSDVPADALGAGMRAHLRDSRGEADWPLADAAEDDWLARLLIDEEESSLDGERDVSFAAMSDSEILSQRAIAERVVGTLRRECLDHLIIVNERHLRLVLRKYVAHYNHVRPHQALELCAPDDRRPRSPPRSEGQVVGRPILGGLHHEYERLAA